MFIYELLNSYVFLKHLLPSLCDYQPYFLFGDAQFVNYGLVVILFRHCLSCPLYYTSDGPCYKSQVLYGLWSIIFII